MLFKVDAQLLSDRFQLPQVFVVLALVLDLGLDPYVTSISTRCGLVVCLVFGLGLPSNTRTAVG